MMKIKYIIMLVSLLPGLWVQAQEVRPISKSEAIELVKRQ